MYLGVDEIEVSDHEDAYPVHIACAAISHARHMVGYDIHGTLAVLQYPDWIVEVTIHSDRVEAIKHVDGFELSEAYPQAYIAALKIKMGHVIPMCEPMTTQTFLSLLHQWGLGKAVVA